MNRVLPILFNTNMVLAILDGRKTVTRRAVKYNYSNTEMKMRTDKYGTRLIEIQRDVEGETYGKNQDGSTWQKLLPYIDKKPTCRRGDILYVRETWSFLPCIECMDEGPACSIEPVVYDDGDSVSEGCFVYKASHPHPEKVSWSPSIHMPKEAARIWLRVTDIKVERLQDMTLDNFLEEGVTLRPEAFNDPDNAHMQARNKFIAVWDSTISKGQQDLYNWGANPWVWIIGFKRCEKPEIEL